MTIRLKLLRKQKGWTLETLAEQSGLTKSYLSKIERGVSMPSIAVALKLAKALQIDVGQLASDAGSDQLISITRASARTAMAKNAGSGGARAVESIAADIAPKEMLPFMLYPPPDFVASAFKEHEGEEFLFVHKGRIDVEFPDQLVQLKAGDSLYFNALIPHRTRSTGSVQAEVMVIVSNRER